MGEDYTNYLLGSKEHYTKNIFIICTSWNTILNSVETHKKITS